jgi:biopolymer transport protein ExbD
VAFKPSDKRKYVSEEAELNLLPILNMIVVLIPLLLTSSEWVRLGLLETRLPPAAAGGGGGMATEQEQPLPKLSLLVAVDQEGVAVSVFGATSTSTEPGRYKYFPRNPTGELDFAGVNQELLRIRREIVKPSIKGKEQAFDAAGNLRYNSDGSPIMVDAYGFDDAETVIISAPNELPFQQLVSLLDATRRWKDPNSNEIEKLFPTPMMGKIN